MASTDRLVGALLGGVVLVAGLATAVGGHPPSLWQSMQFASSVRDFLGAIDEEMLRGDVNMQMAEGIDSSHCVVVFLTARYLAKARSHLPAISLRSPCDRAHLPVSPCDLP